MGNGRQIWGNEIQGATGTTSPPPDPNAHSNTGGGDNGGGADDTPTEPFVTLTDGTKVSIEEFDPYKEQRQQIDADRSRVDGMLEAARGNHGNGNPGNGDETGGSSGDETDDPPVHPLLADNPLLQEIDVENTEFASDFERDLAIKSNNLINYAKDQNKTLVERETEFDKRFAALEDSVSDRFVREDISRIEATTGVTQDEIVAANKATGISDVDTLATLVLGAKARDEKSKEAEAAAQASREQGASNITGTTRANANPGGGEQPTPGRGVTNWRNAKEVAAQYNFKPA